MARDSCRNRHIARARGGRGHRPAASRHEPYWAPYFAKIEPARRWMAEARPDVCVVVYNDHASAFSLQLVPTFALGVAASFPPADEGYGPRPVPEVPGHPELAWHLAESLIFDEFDITIANEMPVDHGCTVPLSVLYGQPERWPCRVVPLCVNVIQYPPPTGHRCWQLGTGAAPGHRGLPRQRAGGRFGHRRHVAPAPGRAGRPGEPRLRPKPSSPASSTTRPGRPQVDHSVYIREAGSEGVELVMWLVMRGALDDEVREVYRMNHVPTSNASNGLLILENA